MIDYSIFNSSPLIPYVCAIANGDKYDGEFKDDEFNGHGVYMYASGDVYVGSFKSDVFHGKGKLSYGILHTHTF